MTVSATFQITPLFAQLKLPLVDGAAPALAEVVVGQDGASHLYLLGKEEQPGRDDARDVESRVEHDVLRISVPEPEPREGSSTG